MATRLKEKYRSEVVEALTREFLYANPLQVPTLHKVVVNVGLGEAVTNPKALDAATRDLAVITAQKPVVTRAKKSVASFKIRTGNAIATTVTLRRGRSWHCPVRLI